MTSSSHLASSSLCYLIASAVTNSPIQAEGLVATAVASILPDIDTPTSLVGRPFFPIAGWIDRKFGHRTITHSFLGVAIFALVVFGLESLRRHWTAPGQSYAWCLILGYGSHLLVDMLNKTGVELFWPAKWRCVVFGNEQCRIAAAGKGDYWLMTACLVLNLAAYPVARDGFTLSLHRTFADIHSVTMDFKQYGDRSRIWLDLEGVDAISNQKIRGRFEILAAMSNASVLILRNGVKQIVGRAEPYHLFPDEARIAIGDPQQVTTQEIDMAGRMLGEVSRFPDAWRVLFYGYLTPVKHTRLSVHEGRYDPISLRLDKIKLEHAEYLDIEDQGLQWTPIQEGKLVAKIYRSVDKRAPNGESPPTPQVRIRHVELRFRPDDEVLLTAGAVVRVGQAIGWRNVDAAVELLTKDRADNIARLRSQLEEVTLHLTAGRAEMEILEKERSVLETDLARLRDISLATRERVQRSEKLNRLLGRIRSQSENIVLLEQRLREIRQSIQARSEQFTLQLRRVEKQAEIRASFGGKILRVERQAVSQLIVYLVFFEA